VRAAPHQVLLVVPVVQNHQVVPQKVAPPQVRVLVVVRVALLQVLRVVPVLSPLVLQALVLRVVHLRVVQVVPNLAPLRVRVLVVVQNLPLALRVLVVVQNPPPVVLLRVLVVVQNPPPVVPRRVLVVVPRVLLRVRRAVHLRVQKVPLPLVNFQVVVLRVQVAPRRAHLAVVRVVPHQNRQVLQALVLNPLHQVRVVLPVAVRVVLVLRVHHRRVPHQVRVVPRVRVRVALLNLAVLVLRVHHRRVPHQVALQDLAVVHLPVQDLQALEVAVQKVVRAQRVLVEARVLPQVLNHQVAVARVAQVALQVVHLGQVAQARATRLGNYA